MRIATISALMAQLAELFPVTYPDAKRVSAWEPQFRATLGSLEGDDLNTAYHGCMDGWTKKAAPSPADILSAHRTRHPAKQSGGEGGKSFMDRLIERDAAQVKARAELIEAFEAAHPKTYAAAEQEGWIRLLRRQAQLGANIIAQRAAVRLSGGHPAFIVAEDLEYYGIMIEGDREELVVTRQMIDHWQEVASTPAQRHQNNIPKMKFASEYAA